MTICWKYHFFYLDFELIWSADAFTARVNHYTSLNFLTTEGFKEQKFKIKGLNHVYQKCPTPGNKPPTSGWKGNSPNPYANLLPSHGGGGVVMRRGKWHPLPGKLHWCTCPGTRCSSGFRPAPWVRAPPPGRCLWPCTWGRTDSRGRCPRAATRGTGPGNGHPRGQNTAVSGSHQTQGGSPKGRRARDDAKSQQVQSSEGQSH